MKRKFIQNNIVVICGHVAEIQSDKGCNVTYKYNHYTEGAMVGSEHVSGISLNEIILNFCGFYKFCNNEGNCELYRNEENVILVGFGSTYYLLDPKFLKEEMKYLHELQCLYHFIKKVKIQIDYEKFKSYYLKNLIIN